MSPDRERYLERAKQQREAKKVRLQKTVPNSFRRDTSLHLESARQNRLPQITDDYRMSDVKRQSMPATTKHSRNYDLQAHYKRQAIAQALTKHGFPQSGVPPQSTFGSLF